MTVHTFPCHTICGPTTSGEIIIGEALVSKDPVCFYMVDHETGTIIEKGHDLNGISIKGKVLVIPSGKGSSVVQDEGLYALRKNNTGPLAIIVQSPDTVLVAGALVMELPMFDKVDDTFFKSVKSGLSIEISADEQKIKLGPVAT